MFGVNCIYTPKLLIIIHNSTLLLRGNECGSFFQVDCQIFVCTCLRKCRSNCKHSRFFLAFLPLDSFRIPLLFVCSLLLRLNIIALFLGTLITVFIPYIHELPYMDFGPFEDYWLISSLKSKILTSESIASGIFGGLVGLVCYFFFHWFYNLGLKKMRKNRNIYFLTLLKAGGPSLNE